MSLFIMLVLSWIIRAAIFVLVIHAILTWLVAFDVVRLNNRPMYSLAAGLEALSRPLLAPFRRIIPVLGGVDVSPLVAIIVLQAANIALVPQIARLAPWIG